MQRAPETIGRAFSVGSCILRLPPCADWEPPVTPPVTQYDRAAEDVGNIVSLEHVNTEIPDQQLATCSTSPAWG